MKVVADLMQEEVFTVTSDDMVDRVFFLIHYEKIRHIPVVEGREVVGIVSDRDLYKALGPRTGRRGVQKEGQSVLAFTPRRVRHIMRRGVVTIKPDASLGVAASMMARRKIGALPVVNDRGRLVGIITATDLLRAFAKLYGKVARLTE